ncbi:DUF1834 family protein [Salmonella enterica]|nr:DUF1834 family protein [Salmonella enterica]
MVGKTETALLARVASLFGATLRRVGTHPGTWNDAAIRSLFTTAPSVHVAWLGAGPGRTAHEILSRWVFYVTAQNLNGDTLTDARALPGQPGVYQIVERLVGGVAGQAFGDASAMQLTDIRNLYTDVQGASGVALYGVYFEARMPVPPVVDTDSLDDFLRHWQTWRLTDGTPEFKAHITLPAPEEK